MKRRQQGKRRTEDIVDTQTSWPLCIRQQLGFEFLLEYFTVMLYAHGGVGWGWETLVSQEAPGLLCITLLYS